MDPPGLHILLATRTTNTQIRIRAWLRIQGSDSAPATARPQPLKFHELLPILATLTNG
jgi:hypothetical protein